MPLDSVRHIVLVLSGKGGVGKSSVSTQLALSLALQGHSVGLLDIDLTGPSIPRFLGVEDSKIRQGPSGWLPVPVHEEHHIQLTLDANENNVVASDSTHQTQRIAGSLCCMSLGFVLPSRNNAVIWRGPKKTAMVRQFLTDVAWPKLNYLLIDTPPGTSDEHISLLETLGTLTTSEYTLPSQSLAPSTTSLPHLAGAVLVTTPQAVSTADVRKELSFCAKTGVKVLGIIENMSGFVCPHCAECSPVFGSGGGKAMAEDWKVPFLGEVPIDPAFGSLIEEGKVPIYPKGTQSTMVANTETGDLSGHPSETASLAQKYTFCALFPLFEAITASIVTRIETG